MTNEKIKVGHIHIWDKKNKGNVAIVKAVQNMLSENIRVPIEIEDFPAEILQNLNDVNLERLNRCDIIAIGGGSIYDKRLLPYDMANLSKINSPVVIYGVGYIRQIGAEDINEMEKKSLYELNNKAALSSVRDYRTRELLASSGVPENIVDIVGDPAIFLSQEPTDKIEFDPGRIKIGMNLNSSSWLSFGQYEEMIINSYNQVGNYFQKNFGAQIFYLKHHVNEEAIISHLDVEGLQVIDLEPQQQMYAYGQLDMVLGMMLTTAVLSFGAGTPFINLGYDVRNQSFGDFIGFPELVIGANELSEGALVAKMMEVFDRRKYYKEKFIERKNEILKSQLEFLGKVEKLIEEKYGE